MQSLTMNDTPQRSARIISITDDEINLVDGAGVDWDRAAGFAGRAVKAGSRLGLWGLAGAALVTAIYVGVDSLNGE